MIHAHVEGKKNWRKLDLKLYLCSSLSTSETASVDRGEEFLFFFSSVAPPLIGLLLRYSEVVNNYLWPMCFFMLKNISLCRRFVSTKAEVLRKMNITHCLGRNNQCY